MATDVEVPVTPPPTALAPVGFGPEPGVETGNWVYDRSSLRGDFMVMIAGQTVEEYWKHLPLPAICEYIDGIVYMPNYPTNEHQDVAGFLFYLLNGFRYERGTGPVRFGPAALVLGETRFPQPDVFVLPPEGREGPPALFLVEVLSPSTRSHDLNLKCAIYREAGIPEFWYVDLDARQVLADKRGPQGYSTEALAEGVRFIESLPGFWINIDWLWADLLPNPRRCLETILAGPPA